MNSTIEIQSCVKNGFFHVQEFCDFRVAMNLQKAKSFCFGEKWEIEEQDVVVSKDLQSPRLSVASTTCSPVSQPNHRVQPCSPKDFKETMQGFVDVVDESEFTTVLVRNLPCRLTQEDFIGMVDTFNKPYDFLYVPKARGRRSGNLGYVFINFCNHDDAVEFMQMYDGYTFPELSTSNKRAESEWAKLQGFQANVDFYSAIYISRSKNRPFVKKN